MKVAALLVLLVAASQGKAAAPPAPGPVKLTPEQQRQIDVLQQRVNRAWTTERFEEAEKAARQIAALREKWQGKRHWQSIDARFEVEIWQRRTKIPRKNRPKVVLALRLLDEGQQLQERLRYREAEARLREALAISRKVLGEEHRDTAQSYNSVGFCLHAQDKHADALPLFRKALEIRGKVLGEEHPDTALSYNNVAFCLNALGKSPKAQPLYEKALAITKKVLGEDHPGTAQSYMSLADCLHQQGKHSLALPLFEKARATCQKALGREHPLTATSYNNLAGCLSGLGKHAAALPLYEQALAIRKKALGEESISTAISYNNLGSCLQAQGRDGEALPHVQKALAIWRKLLGEDHPQIAVGYSNVAFCLDGQGKSAEALPLARKALDVFRKALGEEHPKTAQSYNNLAFWLHNLGRHAEALPLFHKALAIVRKTQEEEHHHTATCYHNLAYYLETQGKHGEALVLFQKALAIRRKLFGEKHPDTALSYNSIAVCLDNQGEDVDALRLYQKALAIKRKLLGEEHPDTALCYNTMAICLAKQGRHTDARALLERALTIRRKQLGEEHPDTTQSYQDLGSCLVQLGKQTDAYLLLAKALAIRRKVLGTEHPDTARSTINMAFCLWKQGDKAGALRLLQVSLSDQETARYHIASSGFDRAEVFGQRINPHEWLALGMARLGQPRNAFRHAEASLARGLLDDLASEEPADRVRLASLSAHLKTLDDKLVPLFGVAELSEDRKRLRDELSRQRREAISELSRLSAAVSARQVLPLWRIQKQIPADSALVLWMENVALGECRGCVVRSEGSPVWAALPGSGKADAWTMADRTLLVRLFHSLRAPAAAPGERAELVAALHKQWLAPLEGHLKAKGRLPAVRQLLVVPTSGMALVPVEVLTTKYTISYVPSGSVFARLREKHRPLAGGPVLALGDPLFTEATRKQPAPPKHGLLVRAVLPRSAGALAGLRSGDVLLRAGSTRLETPDDLGTALGTGVKRLRYWRDGQEETALLGTGALGVSLDPRPVAVALAAWRDVESSVVKRGGPELGRLPGTRAEVETLARLVPGCTTLLGSAASEQRLHRLASSGKLKSYRLVHLGTHGVLDLERPERSFLALARDRLPTPAQNAEAVSQGGRAFSGELSVQTIIGEWDLDADLVVLSACQTALGKEAGGDGMLGFAQALLRKGSRSVVLSRWEVEDTATTLLMTRFYENLLGKRKGLKAPLKRAAALEEAKHWLRGLDRTEALALLGKLTQGVVRGPIVSRSKVVERTLAKAERPYADPFFWAGFVLIGDPD
jgi:tetratricopeptide (TPR) repeat protein